MQILMHVRHFKAVTLTLVVIVLSVSVSCGFREAWQKQQRLSEERRKAKDETAKIAETETAIIYSDGETSEGDEPEHSNYGLQIYDLRTNKAVWSSEIKGEFVKKPDGGFLLLIGQSVLDVSGDGDIRHYLGQNHE